MHSSTLLWTVDATRGSVNFGRLMPFAGNTYELVFVGVALEEVYTAYVMDESGLKCLAKSEHNAGEYKIAFNTADLRDEFERNMHEVQTFHVIVRDSKRVVAEGDLSVQWQSLWEDTTTGEVFTMKGEPGRPGNPGRPGEKGEPGKNAYQVARDNGFDGSEEEWLKTLKGAPGSLMRVQKIDENGNETGKWHNVFVKPDQKGRLRIVIGKTEHEPDASNDVYVSAHADMSVGGKKTFLDGIVGNLEGNVVGNLKGTADRAIADKNGNKIHETYLLRTGGEMTGGIRANMEEFSISAVDDKRSVRISGGMGWGNGASFVARGKNHPSFPGEFICKAKDEEKESVLHGTPDGTLTWGGREVVRSYFSSSWRIITLDGGWVMLYTADDYTGESGEKTYTLPLPMKNTDYAVFTAVNVIGGGSRENHVISRTTTSFVVDSSNGSLGFIVIGQKA